MPFPMYQNTTVDSISMKTISKVLYVTCVGTEKSLAVSRREYSDAVHYNAVE
jgi:hypothetical protein